jgi:hypothetical protein
MRIAAVFVSVVALLWCSAMVLRLPHREVTWAIPTYVLAQFLFSLTAFLGLQRGSETSLWYKAFFLSTFSAVIVLGMIVAGRLVCAYPVGLAVLVIFGSVAIAIAIAATAYYQLLKLYKSHVPYGFAFLSIQGAMLLVCGFMALLSALEPSAPSLHIASVWLSVFWLATGAYFFAYMLGFARTVGVKWDNLNLFVPPMLAAICFGAMAFHLSGLQGEVGQAAVYSDKVQVEAQ